MLHKGVDFVGWRMCTQQREWGPKRFALTLKKIGRQAAELKGITPPVNPRTPEQRRQLQVYQEASQGAALFAKGTPECKDCSLSGGVAYGCYAFVDYPIDTTAERALHAFFSANVEEEGHITASLYRDLMSKVPPKGTAWHTDRGVAGTLAELEDPLVKEWGFLMWKKRVDTSQILGSLFFNQTKMAHISAFAKFWEQFMEWANKNADVGGSTTLQQFQTLSEFYDRVSTAATTQEGIYVLVEDDAPSSLKHSIAPPPA